MAQATDRPKHVAEQALCLSILVFGLIFPSKAQDMSTAAPTYPITIAASAQIMRADLELRVEIDGRLLFEHRPGSAGEWKEQQVMLAQGRHGISVTESTSGAIADRQLDVTGPLWVTTMLFEPPTRIRIDVEDHPVGLQ